MLELRGVEVQLAGIAVLSRIDLAVPAGHIYGLLGPNGAGKTTLLRTVMGLVKPRAGSIDFDGVELLARPSHARASLGVGYMPEDRRLIPNLTVEENILSPTWVVPMADSAARLDRIYDVIEELKPLKRLPASALSGGQQKLAALARALLVGRKLLLLDEPTEGVAPVLAARLGDILNDMRASDTAILVAESNDTVFANLFDRECRLERGVLNPVRTGGDSAA